MTPHVGESHHDVKCFSPAIRLGRPSGRELGGSIWLEAEADADTDDHQKSAHLPAKKLSIDATRKMPIHAGRCRYHWVRYKVSEVVRLSSDHISLQDHLRFYISQITT